MSLSLIQSLQMRALALRSTVHNEQQLSAVELAGMVAKKTNEIIEIVNELSEIVNELGAIAGYTLVYDPDTESLTLKAVEEGA